MLRVQGAQTPWMGLAGADGQGWALQEGPAVAVLTDSRGTDSAGRAPGPGRAESIQVKATGNLMDLKWWHCHCSS